MPVTEERLEALLRAHTAMDEKGFSVDLGTAPEDWHACFRDFGLKTCCRQMSQLLCEWYRERFDREFLFSEDCVAGELAFHVKAFFWASGCKGYRQTLAMLPFSRKKLIAHCKEVDIYTEDVRDLRQRVVFAYARGIRKCFRGTGADPFRPRR